MAILAAEVRAVYKVRESNPGGHQSALAASSWGEGGRKDGRKEDCEYEEEKMGKEQ